MPYSIRNILTQIRLGLNPLGEHLHTYNLSDNSFCQNCLFIVESTAHFAFHCDKCDQEGAALMNNPHVVRLNLHPNNFTDIDELVNTFIRGRENSIHLLTRLFCPQLPDSSPIRSASTTSNNTILSIILEYFLIMLLLRLLGCVDVSHSCTSF